MCRARISFPAPARPIRAMAADFGMPPPVISSKPGIPDSIFEDFLTRFNIVIKCITFIHNICFMNYQTIYVACAVTVVLQKQFRIAYVKHKLCIFRDEQ